MGTIEKFPDGITAKAAAVTLAVGISVGAVFVPAIANAEDVTIRHGSYSDVEKMERYLKRAKRRGIEVELEKGLGNTDCFALFNEAGEEVVRVGPKDARRVVSFAGDLERGETINPTTIAVAGSGCPEVN